MGWNQIAAVASGAIALVGAICTAWQIYQMTVSDAKARGLKHPKFWGFWAMNGNNSSGLILYLIGVTMEMHTPIDLLIVMLGTNDCKTRYNASAGTIAKGLAQVIQKARKNASQPFDLLVISPIHLGEGVGDPGFDPEFDEKSVEVSKKLAEEYHKVALLHHAAFLDASAFASPSTTDREHLDAAGHAALANAIYEKVIDMQKELEKAV